MCMNSLRWELQDLWPFLRSVLLIFQVCRWMVQPSISFMLFKALLHLCLPVLSLFLLFHTISAPALHLIPSIPRQTVPMCRACKSHIRSPGAPSDVYHWDQWDVCEQIWRQIAAQFGFAGYPKSRLLVFFLNGRVCSASRLMQCFPWLGRCIYETLQPSKSPRRVLGWVHFNDAPTILWPFGYMAIISQGIQGHS